jgi:hypothetical protein
MKLRIGIWAAAGAVVVVLWSSYISWTHQNATGIVRILEYLTCPIALASHLAISFRLVLLANTAAYALVGTFVETTWRHYRASRLISA